MTASGGRPPILELRDIRAGYGPIEVVHGVSLVVPAGSVVALLGPNGGGKTTMLSVCAGTLAPMAGAVFFDGDPITLVSADGRARRGICTIPEGRGIFPNLTVRENLLMATQIGVPMDRIEDVAFAQFPRLSSKRKQLAGTLSGGEQQMLALARALAVQPKLVIADEMSLGLAPMVVDVVFDGLQKARQSGITVILIEQFIHRALAMADTCVILSRGHVAWSGAATDAGPEVLDSYLGQAAAAS